MNRLSPAARLYLPAVVALGGCILASTVPYLTFEHPTLLVLLVFLSAVSSALNVNLPAAVNGRGIVFRAWYVVDLCSLLLAGPDPTMLVAMVGAWSRGTFRLRQRQPAHVILYNMASQAIAVQSAGIVFLRLGGTPGLYAGFGWAWPYAAAVGTYYVADSLLGAALSAATRDESVMSGWVRDLPSTLPGYLLGIGAAPVLAALLGRSDAWLVPAAVLPLYLAYCTYRLFLAASDEQQRQLRQASDLHLATIEALALAVDAKDRSSHTHIQREQTYAAGLARVFGMSEPEIQGVKTAALLHDIGKLAVPEHILAKPGPLTFEEFQKVRIHPQVGAEIIATVPFPYPVAPLILSHHERWDGKGYPAGLKGTDIPLGARILAVVDYFEALTSDRPYHRAMSYEAATSVLKQEAGKALDPVIVARFAELLPTLQRSVPQAEAKAPETVGPRPMGAEPWADGEAGKKTVFEDIALAHREIYALYEIAQAMGTSLGVADTMTIIASKLRNLVPFSSCALFLYEESSDSLRCRFATGIESDVWQRLVVRDGRGPTGWVARNRRPVVNGQPSGDLEGAGETSQTTLQSALVCPLVFNERLIGTLSLYHVQAGYYGDDHRRLANRVSEQAGAVIFNSMLFEQTQEDSLTDALTALPNTRFMFMHLARELARAARLNTNVSLMVMDLDNFKEINDTYGHHVGDRALREVAAILRAAIRPYDICVRYAGDEFVVLLSDCGAEEAEAKRLELQRAVDSLFFEARPGRRVPFGISIGTAVFPADGETYEALLATADSRMYRDKGNRKRLGAGRTAPAAAHLAEGDVRAASA